MKTKPPPVRRRFVNEWDEIGYLYDKLLYWLYQREDAVKARPYAGRLQRLLPNADPDHEAILGEECWSLVYETEGNYVGAIKHRENEIRLIRRLHELVRIAPNAAAAIEGYDYADLSDRLDLLAMLYHDVGHLDNAVATLKESQKLCEEQGLDFDGEDLLDEYLEEMQAKRKRHTA